MTLVEFGQLIMNAVRASAIWKGAITTGLLLLAVVGVIAVIATVLFALRQFFKRDPTIRKAYKISVYLLTLSGVIILLFGALVGFFVPVIPGLLLLLLALILLRRIYRNKWMDKNINRLRWQLRLKRSVRRVKKRVQERKEKIGKALRRSRKSKK